MDSTPSATDTSKKSTAAFTEEPALVTSSMEKSTKRKRRVQSVDEILNQRKESSGCKRRRKILGKGARKGYMKGKGGPDNLGCKYKGVRQRTCGKWVAEIRQPDGGPRVWLGTFDNAYNAALAFDEAALAMYGSYAQLNIPEALNPPQSSLIEIDLNLPVALNSDESSFVSSSAMTNPVMR